MLKEGTSLSKNLISLDRTLEKGYNHYLTLNRIRQAFWFNQR